MTRPLSLSFLAVAGFAVTGTAQDLHDGTWKVNPAKSKYTGRPAPQSETVTVTTDATSHHANFDMVFDGKQLNASLSFPLKGGPMVATGFPPDPQIDHGSVKVVSNSKWVFSYFNKDNKLTSTRVVTTDGKVTEAKWYRDGKLLENEVSDKQ